MWYGDWCRRSSLSRNNARTLLAEAIPQLRTAAEAGDPRAQYELAGANDAGLIPDQTLEQNWLFLAASQVTFYTHFTKCVYMIKIMIQIGSCMRTECVWFASNQNRYCDYMVQTCRCATSM